MATTLKHSVHITELGTIRQRKSFVIWSDLHPPIRCKDWAEVQSVLRERFC
jgi:hypothetical protein